MLIYWVLFLLVVVVAFYNKINDNKLFEKISFFIIIILYILIGSIRSWRVGTDTGGYLSLIPGIISQNIFTIIEYERDPFFWIFIKIINLFVNDYLAYFTVIAVLFWSYTAVLIRKYSNHVFLSLLIFISFRYSDFYMNAMRQGISIALIFYSYKYIIESKPIKFTLLVIFASLFHFSAIIFIFSYLLQYIRFEKKLYIIPILITVFVIGKDYIYINFFKYFISSSEQYSMYANDETQHGILYFSLYLTTFIICFLYSRNKTFDKSYNILFNLVFIAVLFQAICLTSNGFNRIAIYFSQFFVLIIPKVYEKMVLQYGEAVSFLFWLFFVLALYVLGGPAPGVVPYKFYWQY